ncbi:MAG: GNAT family N-acetyltransferase [Armatimonadota bacterium]|nr:GNAT family N-acetyltransferase [Armatimonadota bacterium]MDR5697593.1 GNAT family N-acetyltransferase [Armatimonadota bacterium]
MLVAIRPATADDVDVLVALYERIYGDGYSACFDRYGPVGPKDFWWVQSEKDVHVLEINRRPVGMIVFGRDRRRMLVEEVLGDTAGTTVRTGPLDPTDEVLLRRIWQFVVDAFRSARQDSVLLRTHEANPLGLALVRRHELTFVNALRTVARTVTGKLAYEVPDGYALRRAVAGDDREIARIHHECYGERVRPEEIARWMKRPHTRTVVCERAGFTVGYAHGAQRDGIADLWVAVREAHRRKGIGSALACPVVNFLQGRGAARVNHWGLDVPAFALLRRLGFVTERVHLYFERPI